MSVKKLVKKAIVRKVPAKSVSKRVEKTKMEISMPVSKSAKTNLIADVFDTKGKVAGSVTLPQQIFGAKINKELLSQAVRVYLANQRTGNASTKDRGEVHGTTKKVWQ